MVWTIVVLYATLSPPDGIPLFEIPIANIDKIVHFGLFFVHASLVSLASISKNWIFNTFLFGIALAILTEIGQGYVPGRESDLFDMLANAVGMVFGIGFIYFVKKNEYL